MQKRIWASLFAAVLLAASLVLPSSSAHAEGFDLTSLDERYVIVVNADSPTEAYMGLEKNADAQCAPASTTKILTCIVALEKGNLDDLVTISENAVDFSQYNSLMGVAKGEQYTLRDLLYGMMLPSGNDAAVAIAEHIGGSTANFATMMNTKAQEIGMSSSHFVTVHGKDKDEHYVTARDMAVLTAYALKNDTFREIVRSATYTATSAGGKAINLTNSNRLIADMTSDTFTPTSCLYADCIGVKTGDTNRAGKCLIAAAERGGVTIIAVLLGGTLDDTYYLENSLNMKDAAKEPYNLKRFNDAVSLFDFAFASMSETVSVQELANLGMQVNFETQVLNYAEDDAQAGVLTLNSDLDMNRQLSLMSPIMEQVRTNIATLAQVKLSTVYAPVTEGAIVGTVDYIVGDTVLFSATLTASRSVQEGIFDTSGAGTDDTGNASASSDQLIGSQSSLGSGVDTQPVAPNQDAAGSGTPTWIWVLVVALLLVGVVMLVLVAMVQYRKAQRKKAAKRRKQARLREEARRRAQQQR